MEHVKFFHTVFYCNTDYDYHCVTICLIFNEDYTNLLEGDSVSYFRKDGYDRKVGNSLAYDRAKNKPAVQCSFDKFLVSLKEYLEEQIESCTTIMKYDKYGEYPGKFKDNALMDFYPPHIDLMQFMLRSLKNNGITSYDDLPLGFIITVLKRMYLNETNAFRCFRYQTVDKFGKLEFRDFHIDFIDRRDYPSIWPTFTSNSKDDEYTEAGE